MPIDTPPSRYLVVLGDEMIDLLLRDDLDTLSTGDRDIDFNPSRDIEELEHLLADHPLTVLRVFDEPLESDILYFEQLLNEDTFSDVSPTLLPTESSLLVPPLPDFKQICLREVERFDPFFSLTQSGDMTWVMETPSFGFHHMPSPCPAAYSPTEIPSDESKVHIEVLSVLWGNRLPIPDGSLPLSPSHNSSSASPSRKRSRSPAASVPLSSPIPRALSSTHADLLPSPKSVDPS
ncbi:hypothetical protein Tco_0808249 [Tanacetum coccineum]